MSIFRIAAGLTAFLLLAIAIELSPRAGMRTEASSHHPLLTEIVFNDDCLIARNRVRFPCGVLVTARTWQSQSIYARSSPRLHDVLWDEEGLAVLYSLAFSFGEDGPVLFERYDVQGRLTRSQNVGASCRAGDSPHPRLVRNDQGYAAAWICGQEIQVQLLDLDGSPTSPMQTLSADREYVRRLDLARTKTGYAVLTHVLHSWSDDDLQRPLGLYLFQLDSEGRMIPRSAHLVSEHSNVEDSPALAESDGQLVVAWVEKSGATPTGDSSSDPGALLIRFYDEAGPEGDSIKIASGDHMPANPSIALHPFGLQVAWSDSRLGNPQIFASTFVASSSTSDLTCASAEARMSGPSGHNVQPSVEWNGSNYVIAWHNRAPQESGVYAAMASRRGNLRGTPRRVGATYALHDLLLSHYPYAPAIAHFNREVSLWWVVQSPANAFPEAGEIYAAAFQCPRARVFGIVR